MTKLVLNPVTGNFDFINEVTIGTANGLSIVASTQVLSLDLADTSTTGALSSTDWNTFNGKQDAGNYITDLTGDVTASGPGSVAATLATVNGSPGSFGDASHSLSATVNGKGLITALSSNSIQIAESQVTNLVSDLAAKQSTTLTSAHILVGNVSNVATDVAVTGDVTISNAGVTAIGSNKVANSQLAQMAAHTFKGNNTGSTANALDLTATQLTAEINVMVGDSGSGGTKGLAPAPGSGDAAAGKFLKADATYAVPSTSSSRAINAQTVTSYTFALTDGSNNGNNPLVTLSNASAITATVPPNSSVAFPIGTQIDCIQLGAGKVTLAQGAGVTINSSGSNKSIGAQYVGVSLVKTATDTWVLMGNLIA